MLMRLKPLSLALSGAALLTLAACGGGSDSEPEVITPAPTTNVPVKVIDGAIKNALVCLDKNANNACDADETQGRTDASGSVTLAVPDADVGKYRVIAVVGTDAVDADSGPVTVAYTMAAPSDQTAVVSPLTTLVAQTAATQNLSTAEAAKLLQDMSGLPSVMADYTQGGTPGAATAATVARTLVVTTQQQNTALASAVGASAPGGGAVTRAELDAAVANALAQLLPQVVAAAANPDVQAACASGVGSAACTAAIQTQVAALAPQTGLTPTTLPVQVGIDRSLLNPAPEASTPSAGAALDWLRFTDANNWYFRIFVSTAAENTPDAKGLTRFREIRSQNVAGTTSNWTFHSEYARRGDLHYNGSAWVDCPLGTVNTQTARDASGSTETWGCDGYNHTRNTRTAMDIAGQTMSSVVATLRNAPFGYGATSYTAWGTSATDNTDKLALGDAVFPAGAKLYSYTGVTLDSAPGYDPRSSNEFKVYSAGIQAGGDARNNPSHACNLPEFNAAAAIQVTTLEQMINALKGAPCIFGQHSVTSNGVTYTGDPLNEAWAHVTLNLANLGSAPTNSLATTGYFTGNTLIRAAFTGADSNAVTYYSCKQRYDGAVRSCRSVGTGTYAIETLGDGRVLKFTGIPAQASTQAWNRVMVERIGKVYWGYQDKPNTWQRIRLNLETTNALFTKIGIPTGTP